MAIKQVTDGNARCDVSMRQKLEAITAVAGLILVDFLHRERDIEWKIGHELVTSADFASEKHLLGALSSLLPEASFVGEESWKGEMPSFPFWVVDPLDGTNNFARGFPFFSVSIALADEKGISLACVHDPLRRETFSAEKGHGATLNGQIIRTTDSESISEVLLATGFPYRRTPDDLGMNLGVLRHFLGRALGIRRGGSAALDLAYTACGRLGGFWEEHLKPWDMAAGVLLVKEAGGRVSGFDGNPWSLYSEGISAAGAGLFEALRAGISSS